MLATAITALALITAIAATLTLLDSWLRARHALATLRRERALLAAGFVPEVDHCEIRLRPVRHRSVSGPNRPVAPRTVRSFRVRGAA